MVKKEYGRHIANYKYVETPNGGIVHRVLEIYQTKTGIKGLLWRTTTKGWREEPNVPIWKSMNFPIMNYEPIEDTIKRLVEFAEEKFNLENRSNDTEVFHNYGTWKN